jgi:short-subunit dehydrogenase
MLNKKTALIGCSSKLSQCLLGRLPNDSVITFGRKHSSPNIIFNAEDVSTSYIKSLFSSNYDNYIFNIGFLQAKNILEQTADEICTSMSINAIFIIKSCEHIFKTNSRARIFIIGSESGRKGSFDTTYFLSKAMLRSYVRQRSLNSPEQQLLLISPSTIEDSRMTEEREDKDRLSHYRDIHPKQRFLSSDELAGYIAEIITNPSTYLCNTEIEINGGKFARMKT